MIKINIRKKLHVGGGEVTVMVDTELQPQSFTALYGPSGAGKTTLLKILAGLLQPEQGIIEVNGETWLNTDRKINLPTHKRSIGFVFQDYALFSNMTVLENLRYALPNRKDEHLLQSLLLSVSMEGFENRKPDTLSGGQKQRIALIRALVRKPQLLLLDEPLSALDHEMRVSLQYELQRLHKDYQLTTIMVSHHLPEIYRLVDWVLQINEGQLTNSGAPVDLFGLHHNTNTITLVGEVVTLHEDIADVLIENNIISIKTSELIKAGDKVTVSCHATNLTLKKLS
ncbi:ATP-binding cassette domain-containing protein [Mucilaginibacter lacusdianchii]|uniref:ATP-binding cassette domain-containing protein n=1 Tax=Mucilaginibacter lacusdianchii TaxID=2684211 RepID=UPI00131E3A2A|nr:ATP-binding cassette domain-containing protein [Mucilaginibacter sp. JXJ CY 39]